MNAQDVLYYGHTFVTRNLVDLPMSDWETENVCGWWSTKAIIAHLASFEYVLIDALQAFVGGEPANYLSAMNADPGKFNDDQVAARLKTPAQEVYNEYQAQHAKTLALLAKIPAEIVSRPGTLPWYGPEYALDDFIVYQYYGHKREHTAQINVFKDLLKNSGQLKLDLK